MKLFIFAFIVWSGWGFSANEHLPEELKNQLNQQSTRQVGGASGHLPYRIVGIACQDGEHCQPQSLPPFAGLFLKSNIPLDDTRQSRLRPNLISKAVLERKVSACRAGVDRTLTNPEEQCQPTTPNQTGSGTRSWTNYNLRDIRCHRDDVSCQRITEGPYAGLVQRTNNPNQSASWAAEMGTTTPLTNSAEATSQCIENGRNVRCSTNPARVHDSEVVVAIGRRCGPHFIYCETFSHNGQKLIRKSNIMPSDPRYSQTVAVITPHLRKCFKGENDLFPSVHDRAEVVARNWGSATQSPESPGTTTGTGVTR